VRICEVDQQFYATEEIYQSRLTNTDLIGLLKQLLKQGDKVFADAAEPQRIEEIRRAGINITAANKNVKDGIDFIKSRKLFIHQGSANLLKEIKSYKYKNKGQKVTNEPEEPLKLNDHAMDAMRYAAISFKKPKTGLNLTFHR